jgi:hypothetical protein
MEDINGITKSENYLEPAIETGRGLAHTFCRGYFDNNWCRPTHNFFYRNPDFVVSKFSNLNDFLSVNEQDGETGEILRTVPNTPWKIFYFFELSNLGHEITYSLPILFMHEYVSHVFTLDEGPLKKIVLCQGLS